ncbi:proline-rich antigen [Histoplasma capsulatum var. duboisii H88]|uniref:Proline-rich antigen n=3 Tax=Ajellomyces capsulatus TaxID=5037 RepID=A0A8A1LAX5_AJEC8|nr:proline-rich antigen [Histoplasma capsulatum var. duboisii H88]
MPKYKRRSASPFSVFFFFFNLFILEHSFSASIKPVVLYYSIFQQTKVFRFCLYRPFNIFSKMQFSHALIALVAASLANAQLPDIPQCAFQCFAEALGSDGCSSVTDFACHCKVPTLPAKITPCVEAACPPQDQASVSNLVVSQCSAAGVPIVLPPVGTGSATGSSAQPTGAPTESATGTPTPYPTESAPVTTPSVTEGQTPKPTGTGSYTIPTPTGTVPPAPGAGSNLNANIGGIAAALLALAAYL